MNLEWTTTSFVRTWLWDHAYRWSFFLSSINVNRFYPFYTTIWFLFFFFSSSLLIARLLKMLTSFVVLEWKPYFACSKTRTWSIQNKFLVEVQLELLVVFLFFFLYGILISKYVTFEHLRELLASLHWERKHQIPLLVHPDILALTSMPYGSTLRHMMTFNTYGQR